MGMKLTDHDGCRLRRGMYVEAYGTYYQGPDFYKVFNDGEWKAESIHGKVYVLDNPPNMPDSSLMPEGKLNASSIRRVAKDKLQNHLEKMTRSIANESKKIDFLARYLSEKK